jgi:hypothetical protein
MIEGTTADDWAYHCHAQALHCPDVPLTLPKLNGAATGAKT